MVNRWRFWRRDRLSRERLAQVVIATAPASYWIVWGGNPEGLRRALMRGDSTRR